MRTLESLVAVTAVVLVVAQGSGQSQDPDYSYYYEGRLVVLEASPDLVATRSDAAGPPTGPGSRFERDRLSDRGALRARGYLIYRLGPETGQKASPGTARRPAMAVAREIGLTGAQPVFELGGAVKVPIDEVIVAFEADTDAKGAETILGSALDSLGITSLRPLQKNTFVATISNEGDGRAFAVSRALTALPGVAYAEPNCLVLMRPDPPAARLGGFVSDLGPASAVQPIAKDAPAPRGERHGPAGPRASRSPVQPSAQVAWSTLVHETFESGAPGWQGMGTPSPAITTYRSVAGSSSVYMTGGGPAGVPPPGPYPNNAVSQLYSPAVNLSGFEEAYVELWFFARYEDPGAEIYDYALVFLVQGASSYLLEPLIVAYTGDLAADPTTYGGWRHLVARVPPSWRLNGVQVVVQFTSDFSNGAEGVYLDEVWVGGTSEVDSEPISSDAYSARQYELKNSGQIADWGDDTNDLNVPEAWAVQTVSPSVVVAIIDDGVESHGDLNLVPGWNATTGAPGGGPTSTGAAHGQACAGNAGAIRNNGVGVAGTAPGVKIMPVNGGDTDATLAQGINLAVSHGAHVLSNSWGWVGAPSATIQSAVTNALNAGRTVLFAAGNGPDRPPYTYQTAFPCNLTASLAIICVGASSPTDEHKGAASTDGTFTWGSSYVGAGPDVVAPGPWSYTTDRPGSLGYNPPPAGIPATGIDVAYTHDFGGTSSATPKVAGIAALVLSANPGLTGAQVKSILQTTAKDIETAGVDDLTGYGRVDALAAVGSARPDLSIADASAAEGATGATTPLNFTVSLSAASGQAITVNYATADGTATASSDYLPASGTLNIPAGATSGVIAVTLLGDAVLETDETFSVVLSNPVGAAILDGTATGTILNDDAAGFSIDDVKVVEPVSGTASATFTVTLAPPGTASVSYATANGTATAGADYVAKAGTLAFTAATPTQAVAVTVNADAVAEGMETFVVNLSASTGPAIVRSQGTARIVDRGFYTLTPCRIADTRNASGAPALAANGTRTFTIGGKCGVPAAARAVSFNVTVTGPTSAGDLRLFPGGTALPLVSAINYSVGQTRANNAVVPLGAGGTLAVRCDQATGSVHFIIDVNGYLE